MSKEQFNKALDQTIENLLALSKEELRERLEDNKNGDIAYAIRGYLICEERYCENEIAYPQMKCKVHWVDRASKSFDKFIDSDLFKKTLEE